MDATKALAKGPVAEPCPTWAERVPSIAIRWAVVLGCGAFWSGVIYAFAT